MPTKIFVGNLSADTQSDDIRSLFEKYGSVVECDVLNRYGFVHMANEQEAMNAIDGISGLDVHGFKINVELSRSKPRKPGFGDRAGGGGFGDRGRGRGRGGMRGGGRGMGRGMGRGGPPGAGGPRRPYDPYPPVDRYDRYDRYDDYYRGYDRARPYPDPYERERRLPGERPLPPMYDRRPLAGARLTPPTDTYRRPPPEYYDRGAYGAGYETRRELPGQLPPRDPMGDMAARERDPYLSREREYAMADRGDPMRPLPARDPYARERELTGNGFAEDPYSLSRGDHMARTQKEQYG